MRSLLAVLILVLLSGCSTTVPVRQKFPEAVKELQERCPELKKIEGENVPITDMLKVVIQNYNTYYQCSNRVDGWNEWYEEQKKIFESVK